ncbi:tail protein X [Roseibium litorale]|uniref:Tail protein X n=1 Tax=Roseibium litorale TaxID=2803841 RepID=A0ABR9CJ74_9HYPH|nr:tail protein X [Roseibium litorale]MBD8890887.1 tail protein X [Roseibium litorale]
MAVLTSLEGETIEQVVFRHYGRQDAVLLRRVLDAPANKALSASGPFLPIGTSVTMPEVEEETTVPGAISAAVSLWD